MTGFEKMLGYIRALPEQLEYSLQEIDKIPTNFRKVTNVVVAGMGGSAIGGDLLRCYLRDKVELPIITNRDYNLPSLVGPHTLLLIVSFSGNTEESLSCFKEGLVKDAEIVVITSGGELERLAGQSNTPVVSIPSGLPPRAALGYLFTPMLLVLHKAGLVNSFVVDDLKETITVLQEMREELFSLKPDNTNLGWQIATSLLDSLPVIWVTGSAFEVAGMRWKGQLNENAKTPAYYNCIPELNHNEFSGFEGPFSIIDRISLVILQDELLDSQMARRVKVTKTMLGNRVKSMTTVKSRGDSMLARLFSLMYAADFSSVYLAQLYDKDPLPIPFIDELKQQMKNQ